VTHVVAEPCFGCKYTDCVVVCPVECRCGTTRIARTTAVWSARYGHAYDRRARFSADRPAAM